MENKKTSKKLTRVSGGETQSTPKDTKPLLRVLKARQRPKNSAYLQFFPGLWRLVLKSVQFCSLEKAPISTTWLIILLVVI